MPDTLDDFDKALERPLDGGFEPPPGPAPDPTTTVPGDGGASPKDPVQAAAIMPAESDVVFLLRNFGANPKKYLRDDGSLNRELLLGDLEAYRNLFASRVQHGNFY